MRRLPLYLLGWTAAAALAVVVAWQGVGIVGDRVTDQRPAPFTDEQVAARLDAEADPPPGASTTTTDTVPPATTSSTSTTAPAVAPPTTTAAPAGTAPPPTSAAPPTTPPPSPAATTRSYPLVGGSVALRFEASGVTVLWANPNDGFEVEVEPEHGNGVSVEFRSDDHRSRVDGWWDGGPQDRVRDEPDD